MQNIEEKRHITEEIWSAVSCHTISFTDYRKILEHTCTCTWCAERLAAEETKAKKEPPAYLKEQILERVGRPDVQAATMAKQTSKGLRLFWYSLRVGFAVTVSVCLLAVSLNVQKTGRFADSGLTMSGRTEYAEDGLWQLNQASQKAVSWINGFSNFLLHGGLE